MSVQSALAKTLWVTGLLVMLAHPACSNGDSGRTSGQCGGSPNLDRAREVIETSADFEVLVPTYLSPATSAIPEPTIRSPDEISILFPPCPDTTSGVLGPQIILDETTQAVFFPEPGESDPPTERIQVRGGFVLLSEGGFDNTTTVGIDWHQAGLSLSTTFMWERRGGPPPEITDEMKAEAIRVVESIIEQSEATDSGQ